LRQPCIWHVLKDWGLKARDKVDQLNGTPDVLQRLGNRDPIEFVNIVDQERRYLRDALASRGLRVTFCHNDVRLPLRRQGAVLFIDFVMRSPISALCNRPSTAMSCGARTTVGSC